MNKNFFENRGTIFFVALSLFLAALFLFQPSKEKGSTTIDIFDSKDYPKDFNFKLSFGVEAKNQIDTYKGTLTKDLISNGTKTINFEIPAEMKKAIYSKAHTMKIATLPDNLNRENIVYVKPNCDYILTITANGKTKTIKYRGAGWSKETYSMCNNEQITFMEFKNCICEYIYGTAEYKGMPEAKGGYL